MVYGHLNAKIFTRQQQLAPIFRQIDLVTTHYYYWHSNQDRAAVYESIDSVR